MRTISIVSVLLSNRHVPLVLSQIPPGSGLFFSFERVILFAFLFTILLISY